MTTEAQHRARFDEVRYAQCWEDADVLLDGLDVQPGDTCLSIASAGDNALALLTRDPARVYAIDLNPAQLACVELRRAAYRTLQHDELLELLGSCDAEPGRRPALYKRCREALDDDTRQFWDDRPTFISAGVGTLGKFERYFRTFRSRVLPLVHGRRRVERLLRGGSEAERRAFYDERWDTPRWRLLFRVFFSRFVMGRLGRDPAFFRYVEGTVAERILERTEHALTALDPADNPYLQFLLTGRHRTALPVALRPEHFETIRDRLDRLVCRRATIESFLDDEAPPPIDRFNLSDIFEYMSEESTAAIFDAIARRSPSGARLVYWNMLVPRHGSAVRPDHYERLDDTSRKLHDADKAFFYCRVNVERRR